MHKIKFFFFLLVLFGTWVADALPLQPKSPSTGVPKLNSLFDRGPALAIPTKQVEFVKRATGGGEDAGDYTDYQQEGIKQIRRYIERISRGSAPFNEYDTEARQLVLLEMDSEWLKDFQYLMERDHLKVLEDPASASEGSEVKLVPKDVQTAYGDLLKRQRKRQDTLESETRKFVEEAENPSTYSTAERDRMIRELRGELESKYGMVDIANPRTLLKLKDVELVYGYEMIARKIVALAKGRVGAPEPVQEDKAKVKGGSARLKALISKATGKNPQESGDASAMDESYIKQVEDILKDIHERRVETGIFM